ncbi:MAG: c-type cytochrome, partial [Gallionella sp.]
MIHSKNDTAICLALAVLFAASSAFASSDNTDTVKQRTGGDPVAGKTKSQICQGCHGADGNSTDELIPKLAGQYEIYISKQLRNYQAGTRSHEIMNGMAAPLSDQDLADISAYFANQPKMKGNGSTSNEQGKNIFLKGNILEMVMTCVNCHGAGGKGLNADTPMYPVIGGQHKAYLLKQLIDFREDDRVNSPNIIMNRIVRSLSDEDLEALAEYIS